MNDFEIFYRRIGRRTGPFATRDARQATRDFWVASGRDGAEWLVDRLVQEIHLSLLEGVANLLADIGAKSIEPILRALEAGVKSDQAQALLNALSWIEAAPHAISIDPVILEKVMGRYLSDADPDVREAACAATSILQL
jgi:hypothetical protein